MNSNIKQDTATNANEAAPKGITVKDIGQYMNVNGRVYEVTKVLSRGRITLKDVSYKTKGGANE